MKEFLWPVRVYYEDTDSGGVVYYANYLKFMERARTEWLRSFGIEQDVLIERDGIIFAVTSVQADYLKPARFNQSLTVSAEVVRLGKASITFKQQVRLAGDRPETEGKGLNTEEESVVLCEANIKIACLNEKTLRPAAIPSTIISQCN